MLSYYSQLRARLKADLTTTLGPDCRILFGRPTKPKASTRYGIVYSGVDRQGVGRQVKETWTFTIYLLEPIPPSGEFDAESALYDLAGTLTSLLAPYDLNTVPASAGLYAEVANLRKVGRVATADLRELWEDTATHVGILVEFSCMTVVYQ